MAYAWPFLSIGRPDFWVAHKSMIKKIGLLALTQNTLLSIALRDPSVDDAGISILDAIVDAGLLWDLVRRLKPDVLILDVEFHGVNAQLFVEKLMRVHPLPVLLFTRKDFAELNRSLIEAGAVECFFADYLHTDLGIKELVTKLQQISKLEFKRPTITTISQPALSADVVLPLKRNSHYIKTQPLIIVGASTGGTEAIKDFLMGLPRDAPAVLIAQHMPEMFTKSFAQRLDSLAKMSVKEAEGGEPILAGCAYIAPGHSHLLLRPSTSGYCVELSQAPPVNRHRPSVDVLFRSAANEAGANAVGVILTGMGKDGAAGLLEMKQSGARTIAQDEDSCVVFGMPKEAIAMGGADEILPLGQIANKVMQWVRG